MENVGTDVTCFKNNKIHISRQAHFLKHNCRDFTMLIIDILSTIIGKIEKKS